MLCLSGFELYSRWVPLHYHMCIKGHGSAAPPSGRSENDEEGKLFLSITVLYCHDYLNFLVEKAFQVN